MSAANFDRPDAAMATKVENAIRLEKVAGRAMAAGLPGTGTSAHASDRTSAKK
ncbi:MAG: hypothetical protein V4724_22675 [Pseudomonadota bacterium]